MNQFKNKREISDKKAVLVVSFGTSYEQTREASIGAIEKKIEHEFPEYEIRRAFTSQMIIDKLKKRDCIEIDNVKQAMERLVSEGFEELVIQPTHVMEGEEYDGMIEDILPYQSMFKRMVCGAPLLVSEEDFENVIHILDEITKEYQDEKTALVFMGHGTEHEANYVYTKLSRMLKKAGKEHFVIGTVEALPDLENVVDQVEKLKAEKVVLQPLMIVAGDHANNDMAGEDEDSWKSNFCSKGYKVECILKGLGEFHQIQQMFVSHAKAARHTLDTDRNNFL